MVEQIEDTAPPGFVGVAANVDAAHADEPAARHGTDLEIDVEDQVADLLHPADGDVVGAERTAEPQLAAIAAAQALTDATEQAAATQAAEYAYLRAQVAYRQTMDGIVVNDTIKSAVLLIVGHLYAQREDVVVGVSVAKLPNGAEWLLAPYKVYA